MSEEEITRIYWLFRALKDEPGFSYRANGLFEYWGVPLRDIPVSVQLIDREGFPPRYPETRADLYAVSNAVDLWLARRQAEIAR